MELHREVMHDGRRTVPDESLETMAARCSCELSLLPEGCLRLINPHRYKVSISERLHEMRSGLIENLSPKR
jgi:nicotinate phosphoribosyltransferase